MLHHLSATARRALTSVLTAGLLAAGTTACLAPERTVVAFLVADDVAERWNTVDAPAFEAEVAKRCDGCDYELLTADGDADIQEEQFNDAVKDGVDVIVLNAVDTSRAAGWMTDVEIPVIAYDRAVDGADYLVSVDPTEIGTLMGEALADEVGRRGRILMIEGPSTDSNAAAISAAAREALSAEKVDIVDTLTPDDWQADAARDFVEASSEGLNEIDGIFASNDTQAAGVAQALADLQIPLRQRPWVTGQDAELSAVRRVLAGEQGMSVYKQLTTLAQEAARVSVLLLTGNEVTGLESVDGTESLILEPQLLTDESVAQTVVRDRAFTLDEICEGELEKRCVELSLR